MTQLAYPLKTSVSCSVASDSLPPHGLYPARLLCLWDSPGKNTEVGCHFLLQGIFPTQGSNPGLLHCRQILHRLSHQGSHHGWQRHHQMVKVSTTIIRVVVQSLICVQLSGTPCTTAHQSSLSFTISHTLCKFMSTESVTLSNHLIPFSSCPQFFPASESFPMSQFSVSGGQSTTDSASAPVSNEHSGLISFMIDWFDLPAVQGTLKTLLWHYSSKASILWH